eukprot:COSAG06_NODE_1482_length_9317_cov_8.315578_2_plen_176_part_00
MRLLDVRSPQPTQARPRRQYLSPARPNHLQSGPESTGYLHVYDFPPCSALDRSTPLSLRLESRGPICPQGRLQHKKQSITMQTIVISVDSGATPDSDALQVSFSFLVSFLSATPATGREAPRDHRTRCLKQVSGIITLITCKYHLRQVAVLLYKIRLHLCKLLSYYTVSPAISAS